MINFRNNEKIVVCNLEYFLKLRKGKDVPVIFANQVTPIPNYPYVSYTITTPVVSDMKGYWVKDGKRYKTIGQVWSFTVQSDDDVESVDIAMEVHDWFSTIGREFLSDRGIAVQRVSNITNRDNLLSVEYEHRNGFDVTFLLMNEVNPITGSPSLDDSVIEEVITTGNKVIEIKVTKEVKQ